MSSAKSGSDILAARERRQELLDHHLRAGCAATLFLSLNIPGNDKTPPGSRALFSWALNRLMGEFPALDPFAGGNDRLGPWALMGLACEASEAKRSCVALEHSHPAARLVDLDVYDRSGLQLGRSALSLPRRPCLVCPHPAVECMRLGRHSFGELVAEVKRLLAIFRRNA